MHMYFNFVANEQLETLVKNKRIHPIILLGSGRIDIFALSL